MLEFQYLCAADSKDGFYCTQRFSLNLISLRLLQYLHFESIDSVLPEYNFKNTTFRPCTLDAKRLDCTITQPSLKVRSIAMVCFLRMSFLYSLPALILSADHSAQDHTLKLKKLTNVCCVFIAKTPGTKCLALLSQHSSSATTACRSSPF